MNEIGARFNKGDCVYVIKDANSYPYVLDGYGRIVADHISHTNDYVPVVYKAKVVNGTLTIDMYGTKKLSYMVRFFPPPWETGERERARYEEAYAVVADDVLTRDEAIRKVEDIYEAQCAKKKTYIMSL